jgi:hypothetical protein
MIRWSSIKELGKAKKKKKYVVEITKTDKNMHNDEFLFDFRLHSMLELDQNR